MLQFGMSRYVMRVKEELQFFLHPHNNRTYQDIPNSNIHHKNAPEDGLLKSETCWATECYNVMNKINHQILCILLDYIHIAKWYTAHTISDFFIFIINCEQNERPAWKTMIIEKRFQGYWSWIWKPEVTLTSSIPLSGSSFNHDVGISCPPFSGWQK